MRPDDQATVFGTPMQTKTQASASSTGKMKLPKLIQHSFENKAFVGDYEDERNEILMQRDLQEELEKWYWLIKMKHFFVVVNNQFVKVAKRSGLIKLK